MTDRLEYALRGSDISILRHRLQVLCPVYEQRRQWTLILQRNISTNERKRAKLLPHPILHAVTKFKPIHRSKCTVFQRESPKERLSALVSANFGSSPGCLITMSVSDLPASVIKFQQGHSTIWRVCSLSLKETTKKGYPYLRTSSMAQWWWKIDAKHIRLRSTLH